MDGWRDAKQHTKNNVFVKSIKKKENYPFFLKLKRTEKVVEEKVAKAQMQQSTKMPFCEKMGRRRCQKVKL